LQDFNPNNLLVDKSKPTNTLCQKKPTGSNPCAAHAQEESHRPLAKSSQLFHVDLSQTDNPPAQRSSYTPLQDSITIPKTETGATRGPTNFDLSVIFDEHRRPTGIPAGFFYEATMPDAVTVSAKYVFLDIVGYSRNRSVEAQTDIIAVLNELVHSVARANHCHPERILFIPTGDGICISLLNIDTPYDAHLAIALDLLAALQQYNSQTSDPQRQFQVRIGVNENVDNQVVDINGQRNVAGAGINVAQRVMGLAGANNIFLTHTVYDRLSQREKYMGHFVKHLATVKHGLSLTVFQYVDPEALGLNSTPPTELQPKPEMEPKLDQMTAYYFANLVKHSDFIKRKMTGSFRNYSLRILIWILAQDCVTNAAATGLDLPSFKLDSSKTLEQHLTEIDSSMIWVLVELSEYILFKGIDRNFHKYLIGYSQFAVSEDGIRKLQIEWPDVAREFGLLQ
jgi:class 3 adenylate cyclase